MQGYFRVAGAVRRGKWLPGATPDAPAEHLPGAVCGDQGNGKREHDERVSREQQHTRRRADVDRREVPGAKRQQPRDQLKVAGKEEASDRAEIAQRQEPREAEHRRAGKHDRDRHVDPIRPDDQACSGKTDGSHWTKIEERVRTSWSEDSQHQDAAREADRQEKQT